ncbi:hypothetical protein AAC03nite_22280 [Alicyclobacillus acidoterrestris]|nr:hypothetical protein AAC03nite_22280 [Alicyclobacillus acidoterrestris]
MCRLCVVIDDIDRYAKTYNDDYGIGPWAFFDFNGDTIDDMTLRGERRNYRSACRVVEFLWILRWDCQETRGDHLCPTYKAKLLS